MVFDESTETAIPRHESHFQSQYFAKLVETILWRPIHQLPFAFFAASREVVDGIAMQPLALSAKPRSQVPGRC